MKSHEEYVWYKEHGICTHCRKEKAEKGKTLCLACLIDNRSYKSNKEKKKEYQKEYDKNKRAYRKEHGLCVNCGKRPQYHGLLCNRCYSTVLRRKAREKSDFSRSERRANGICYICGKNPVIKDKGVCESCYEVRLKAIKSCCYMTKEEKDTYWKDL